MTRPAILIAGPTASGKSGLALAIARDYGGEVINADSMQVYDGLSILTARPGAADLAQVPHRLYGVLPPSETCSAARWRDLAAAEMEECWAAGRLPVVVGGTGLYLRTLKDGISPVPEIADAVRDAARARFEALGNAAFHAELAARDPVMAARLLPSDSQRMIRAWEVIEATGTSLAQWQAEPPQGAIAARWFTLAILPQRQTLYATCDGRFRAMMALGALEEVRAFTARGLDPALPVMKALGLRELQALLRGEMEEEEAVAAAQQATRNYAKRQMTWFRHQLDASLTISEKFSESLLASIFLKIRHFLLTLA